MQILIINFRHICMFMLYEKCRSRHNFYFPMREVSVARAGANLQLAVAYRLKPDYCSTNQSLTRSRFSSTTTLLSRISSVGGSMSGTMIGFMPAAYAERMPL